MHRFKDAKNREVFVVYMGLELDSDWLHVSEWGMGSF